MKQAAGHASIGHRLEARKEPNAALEKMPENDDADGEESQPVDFWAIDAAGHCAPKAVGKIREAGQESAPCAGWRRTLNQHIQHIVANLAVDIFAGQDGGVSREEIITGLISPAPNLRKNE
jgi:hypothetical protein